MAQAKAGAQRKEIRFIVRLIKAVPSFKATYLTRTPPKSSNGSGYFAGSNSVISLQRRTRPMRSLRRWTRRY
jgi:hypothetical protein